VKTTSNDKQHEGTSIQEQSEVPAYFDRKAWLVRIVGAVLLALASPIIVLLILVVRLTSSGPGLYRQVRTGRHRREFIMYKIRTMYDGAESVTGPVWCRPGDSRITPIGKVLRLLHLDELPQLINVTRGEMDLIGPRPERPAFVAHLIRSIPNYHVRLRVRPGVTGLAQVNLPPDETLDCVQRKLMLDCAYIREAGPGLDLRILLCTALRMIGIRHGRAVRWLRLERNIECAHADNDPARKSVPHWLPPSDCQPEEDFYVRESVNGLAFASALASENESTVATKGSELGSVALSRLRMPR